MTDDQLDGALATTIQTARAAERDLFGALDPAIRERPIREGTGRRRISRRTSRPGRAGMPIASRACASGASLHTTGPSTGAEEDEINAELPGD